MSRDYSDIDHHHMGYKNVNQKLSNHIFSTWLPQQQTYRKVIILYNNAYDAICTACQVYLVIIVSTRSSFPNQSQIGREHGRFILGHTCFNTLQHDSVIDMLLHSNWLLHTTGYLSNKPKYVNLRYNDCAHISCTFRIISLIKDKFGESTWGIFIMIVISPSMVWNAS